MSRYGLEPGKQEKTITVERTSRVIRLIVMLSLVVCLAPAFAAHAAQNNNVVLKLEAGFEGYFRSNQWVPLLIKVSNNGPDISGELRVTSSGNSGLTAGQYSTPIDLPMNSSKEVFLYITLGYGAGAVRVELASPDGIIADDTQNVKAAGPSDVLFAVITESPLGAIDLKSVRTGTGDSHQINWRADNIPPSAPALRALDVLMLTDMDSGNLTTDQRQAIQAWVLGGGHLIVSGGPNWQRTQAGVADLLPLKPTGTTTLTSLQSLAAFAGRETDKLSAPNGNPIIVAQGTLTADAKVLAQDSGIPLFVRRAIGSGYVDYLAVDPGLEPYLSWTERGKFWYTTFTTTGQRPDWADGITDPGAAFQAANFIKGLRLPDVFQLCGFLMIYIILIGPLNYLILKRLGRRELAWVTIPVIIVMCSTTAYVTGFSLRGTQAIVNRLSLVEVWPGNTQAKVQTVIGLLSPRRANYTLSVKDGLTLQGLNTDAYGGAVASNSFGPAIDEAGTSYTAQDVPVDAGLTAAFTSTGFVQAQPLDANATIVFVPGNTSAQSTMPRVRGTVKNTTGQALENAVVLAMGGRQQLGTLNPGEQTSFDFALAPNPARSAPLSLGTGTAPGFYSPYTYSGNTTQNTIMDIMGNAYNPYSYYGSYNMGYGETSDQQELRRRQSFLRAIIENSDPSGGRGTDVYLVGWTGTSPLQVDLQGAPYTTEDTSLYIYKLPVTIAATKEEVVIPNSMITWTPTEDTTRREAIPYTLSLQFGDKVAFRYNPLPLARLTDVTELKLEIRSPNLSQGVVSLFDWTTDQWVPVQANTPVVTIPSPDKFVGPENAIEVMIELAPGASLATYDKIDMTLSGHLTRAE